MILAFLSILGGVALVIYRIKADIQKLPDEASSFCEKTLVKRKKHTL